MNLSDAGAKFIAGHEGLRLETYNDPAGHCTVGIGHLIHKGNCTAADRAQWGRLTEQQAYDLFRSDARRFIDAVAAAVTVPITQNQFDALVSFSFNVGGGAFRKSTLLRKLNAGDYQGAANEFPKWNKAGGRVLKGLTRRRAEEAALFLRADAGGAATIEIPRPTPQPVQRVELQRGPSTKFGRAEWLHPVFRIRLEALHDVVPFTVTSGGRSTKRQAELYALYRAGKGNPANRPGTSWHEYAPDGSMLAEAADIEPARGHTDADLHRAAGRFGLHFPIKHEPWHIQPLENKSSKRVAGQGLGPVPSVIEEPTVEEEDEEDMIKYGLITPQGGGPIFGVFVVPEEMELSDGTILEPGMLAKVGFTNGNVLEAVISGGYAKPGQPLIQLAPEEWDRIPHVGNV